MSLLIVGPLSNIASKMSNLSKHPRGQARIMFDLSKVKYLVMVMDRL